MKRIYAFDFDGTLTTRDTLLAFIRYAKGTGAFLWGFLRHAHLLVLMKLGLYPNWKAKQRVFSYFFKGMSLEEFDTLCRQFAADNRELLRPEGVKTLQQAQADGAEVKNGHLSGLFLTQNCYGEEKVRRILALYPDRSEYHLIAFGDSRGDKELLAFADEAHYKPFRL